MIDKATAEDLARDLAADLFYIDDISRDVHLGWAFGLPQELKDNYYALDVYEFAEKSRDGWPAAVRLAMHWKAEAERLQHDLATAQGEIDRLVEDRTCIRTDAERLRHALRNRVRCRQGAAIIRQQAKSQSLWSQVSEAEGGCPLVEAQG